MRQCLIGFTLLCVASLANANLTITIVEVGPNVVATASGSIDTTALVSSGSIPSFVAPVGLVATQPTFVFGDTGPLDDYDLQFTNGVPSAFGPGSFRSADSHTGTNFLFESFGHGQGQVWLPQGYVSGSTISTTVVFNSATYASLGITEGVYRYDFQAISGTGATQSLTVIIPEPRAAGFAGMVLALVAVVIWRRRA